MSSKNYFSIVNLEKHQHYKNRNPPWIKLHASILTDYEFSCLQDASKLLLIHLWLLASRSDNRIPADLDYLQKVLHLDSKPDLEPLYNHGFIEIASEVLADCKQMCGTEESRGEESREEKASADKSAQDGNVFEVGVQAGIPRSMVGQAIKVLGEVDGELAVYQSIGADEPLKYLSGIINSRPKPRKPRLVV